MKKVLFLLVIISIILSLSSCFHSYDVYIDSLDQYREEIAENRYEFGFSDAEIDAPAYFLPSDTFISDFDYIEGSYHYYYEYWVREIFGSVRQPEISLLVLEYEEDVYLEAKDFMLKNIEAYDDTRYIYGSYCFYENLKFANFQPSRLFPKWFVMAGYNDNKHILVFLGFENGRNMKEEYRYNLEDNWTSFIDEYYGKYYDFSD